VLEIWDLVNRYALGGMPSAIFDRGRPSHIPTDIMAEMEGFGKDSQLFIASKVVEFFLAHLNRPAGQTDKQSRQDPQAFIEGELNHKGEVGENRSQTNP